MNKTVFFLIAVLITTCINAQSTKFTLKKQKDIDKIDGAWESWPNEYIVYKEVGKPEPYFMVTKGDDGSYFLDILVGNNVLQISMLLVYDEELTITKMKEWDDSVYCYRDSEGDMVFLTNISLEHLVKYPSLWTDLTDRSLTIWLFSVDRALFFK